MAAKGATLGLSLRPRTAPILACNPPAWLARAPLKVTDRTLDTSRKCRAVDASISLRTRRLRPTTSVAPFQTRQHALSRRTFYSSVPRPQSSPSLTDSKSSNGAPRSRRVLTYIALTATALLAGYAIANPHLGATALHLANPPSSGDTLLLWKPHPSDPAHAIEAELQAHPLALALFADSRFTASRPHLKIPPTLRPYNFTAGTLLHGPDKLCVPALVFSTDDGSELICMQYVGQALCGHPGIVHGGLLATLMDEGLARCCFPRLPNRVGVTASLKMDYRAPCKAGQFIVLRAETLRAEGRKAWVKGRIETAPLDGEPVTLVEAEALFVEPKGLVSKIGGRLRVVD